MKKNYIQPVITEQEIQQSTVLCSSGRASSNIGVGGGDKSGDAADAF